MKTSREVLESMTDEERKAFKSLDPDPWWTAVMNSYNSHYNLFGEPEEPNVLLLDSGSYKVLKEKIVQYSAQDTFNKIEKIVFQRIGKSVFRFYKRIKVVGD